MVQEETVLKDGYMPVSHESFRPLNEDVHISTTIDRKNWSVVLHCSLSSRSCSERNSRQ